MVVISAIIWKPDLVGRHSYIYRSVVDPLNDPLSGPANMRIAPNASLTMTAPVAASGIIVTFVVGAVLSHGKKRRLTSKKGYPLPPGPPPRLVLGRCRANRGVRPSCPTPFHALVFNCSLTLPSSISNTFNEWAGVYGLVITLRQGSEISIVITRVDVRHNLFPLHKLHLTNHSFHSIDSFRRQQPRSWKRRVAHLQTVRQ